MINITLPTPTKTTSQVRHPKCRGTVVETMDGPDYGCDYETTITCEQCKYCLPLSKYGKDPEAKRNQTKNVIINIK